MRNGSMAGSMGCNRVAMVSLNLVGAFAVCVVLLAGSAGAQTEQEPAPQTTPQPLPGIMLTPPWLPPQRPASGQSAPPPEHSCPATDRKLELVV